VPAVARPVTERWLSRVMLEPPTLRMAVGVIVSATAAVVIGGGVLMRVFDHSEYSNIWVGMWWALQTVTTVGYGDVTPTHPSGRIIGAVVMLWGIAFVTITVASLTSIFVSRAAKARGIVQDETEAHIATQLDGIEQRLDRLEKLLRSGPVP
jgi:voltage-gated potassium channel